MQSRHLDTDRPLLFAAVQSLGLTQSEVAAQMRALVSTDDRPRSDLKALEIGEEIA